MSLFFYIFAFAFAFYFVTNLVLIFYFDRNLDFGFDFELTLIFVSILMSILNFTLFILFFGYFVPWNYLCRFRFVFDLLLAPFFRA